MIEFLLANWFWILYIGFVLSLGWYMNAIEHA